MSRMNDDRRSQAGRSIREIISDATDRELEDFDTGSLSPDRLRAMAAAEERRRKRRIRRISGIAALFVLVLACGAFLVFSTFTADVEADKNPKEEIVTEDGVIIEDGGWGSSSEEGWVITDWNEVKTAKASIPELVIPEYVPEGYEFERLTINDTGDIKNIEYIFVEKNENEIIIKVDIYKEMLEGTEVYETDRKISTSRGDVYICEGTPMNNAIIKLNDGIIMYLWTNLSDYEIQKIIEGIDY